MPVLENVSSSRIRELLHAGETERGGALLGRPPEVEGIVVHGDGRGRELGFPTANLDVPQGLLIPPDGVYAGWTRDRLAAISIGTNPQFDGVERRVEAHLLDFDDDLYDQRLVVEIWSWRPRAAALRLGRGARRRRSATTSSRSRAAVRPG